MNKRIAALLAALILLMTAAAACAKEEMTDESAGPSGGPSSAAVSETDAAAGTSRPPEEPDTPEAPEETPDTPAAPSGDGGEAAENGDMSDPEFSFLIGSLSLTLRQHDVDDDLAALIQLDKISDETEELGPGNDTFTGSFVRTVTYDGLELRLFAPKDDPDNFWIMQMTATSNLVETFRFVRVGDSAATLTEKYPEAVQWEEGRYIYYDEQADDPLLNELVFSVDGGVITRIGLNFYLP